jgi:hypothetical protein
MQKCPITTRITVGDDGRWRLRYPDRWSREGKENQFRKRKVQQGGQELVEVVTEVATGRIVRERVLLGPMNDRQRDCFDEGEEPAIWQRAVLIEAEYLCRRARTERSRRAIWLAAVILVRDGQRKFSELRELLDARARFGHLRSSDLAQMSPATCNERTLRRWMTAESWAHRIPSGHFRIRVCNEFVWWYLKQHAAELARQWIKKNPAQTEAIEWTSEALKAAGSQSVPIRRSDVADTIRLIAMDAHCGMSSDEIIKSKHPALLCTLAQIPEKFFRKVKGRELEIAQAIGELGAKGQTVSRRSVGQLIGKSRATMFREPYRSLYDKWVQKIEDTGPMSDGKIRSKTTGKMVSVQQNGYGNNSDGQPPDGELNGNDETDDFPQSNCE